MEVRSGEKGLRAALALALLLAAGVAALYWPATGFDFVAYDDQNYVTGNPAVRAGITLEGVKEAFASPRAGFWIPLTWLSLMADVSLWGTSPFGFHLTNLLLFSAGAALLLLLFWRLTGDLGVAGAAAALFALHPMRVESVAWVTERKDCLALLFLAGAALAWLRGVRTGRARWHAGAAALYALGLMSKQSLVPFPLLLLILDWWPLGRWSPPQKGEGWGPAAGAAARLAREKAPLFLLSAGFSLLTLATHRSFSFDAAVPDPWAVRIERLVTAPFIYLRKTVFPSDLMPVNQRPWSDPHGGPLLLAVLALAGATWWLARGRRDRPWALAGWLWFLVALLPSAGLVRTGMVWIADRFSLVPHAGLFLALAAGGGLLARRLPSPARRALPAALVLVLAVLALLTRNQLPLWRDSLSLTLPAMCVQEEDFSLQVPFAHLEGLSPQARPEAIASLREVLKRCPDNAPARFHLGNLLFLSGQASSAEPELRFALQKGVRDKKAFAWANERMGEALIELGRPTEAVPFLREALSAVPGLEVASFNLATALSRLGRDGEAAEVLERARALSPSAPRAAITLVQTLLRLGRVEAAAAVADEVARHHPGTAEAALAAGLVLEGRGRPAEAAALFRQASTLRAVLPETSQALRRMGGSP